LLLFFGAFLNKRHSGESGDILSALVERLGLVHLEEDWIRHQWLVVLLFFRCSRCCCLFVVLCWRWWWWKPTGGSHSGRNTLNMVLLLLFRWLLGLLGSIVVHHWELDGWEVNLEMNGVNNDLHDVRMR
jgi:hypothetical protein